MSTSDFIVFGQPDLHPGDLAEVLRVLESRWIGTGPRSQELERRFAEYVGASHAIGVNSCTAALHLGLVALGIGPGDEVVVPSMTFGATANVVVHVGATPVFADVDRHTRNLTAETLAPALSERTRAVIPVHLAGVPCDHDAIRAAIAGRNVQLLVDAAHAIETHYRGRPLGALGELTAYSFYVTKNMTTGEGGMLTTADPVIAERIRTLSLHGLSADAWSRYSGRTARTYEVVEPGFKCNLIDTLAALGLRQLERIESSLARRGEIWRRYDAAFADLPLELPPLPEPAFGRSALHLYSPLLDTERVPFDRDALRERLHGLGIGTGVHFTALHLHAYYRERFGYRGGEFPNAETIGRRTFSLPLSPGLTDAQVDRVIAGVREVLAPYA